ncbi:hypothetical protein ACJX0J_007950, partial [Zea mays]
MHWKGYEVNGQIPLAKHMFIIPEYTSRIIHIVFTNKIYTREEDEQEGATLNLQTLKKKYFPICILSFHYYNMFYPIIMFLMHIIIDHMEAHILHICEQDKDNKCLDHILDKAKKDGRRLCNGHGMKAVVEDRHDIAFISSSMFWLNFDYISSSISVKQYIYNLNNHTRDLLVPIY